MKLKLYNHHYLNDDSSWVFTFLDQMKLVEDSELLDVIDSFEITALGNTEQVSLMLELASTYPKIIVNPKYTDISEDAFTNDYDNLDKRSNYISETPTIRKIWEDSMHDDFYVLYFHNKGATALSRFFKQHDVNTFKNYYYWRKFIEWGVIENWKECVKALNDGNEFAGCNYNMDPFPHFSGGFWWSRSDYIRTLDDISDSHWWKTSKAPFHVDRLVNEMWPMSKANKIYNLHSPPARLCSPNPGLYSECYPRKKYIN